MPLTNTAIAKAKRDPSRPVKLADGHGLYLEVRPTGAKLWRWRYRIAGKENLYALGVYVEAPTGESDSDAATRRNGGAFTLAEARVERERCRRLVKQGIHPSHNRQATRSANIAEGANTFEAIAKEWIEKNKVRWSGHYHRQVESFLKSEVYPHVGRLPIRAVTAAKLLDVVRKTEARAPTVAYLIRQWSSAIFRYAIATLRADGDPTVALKGAIHRPKSEHRKPLSRADIPLFLSKLDEHGGYRATVIAMRLLMLTFVRPVELRGAEWSEFDLDAAMWRIPAERMKMREPHTVPLSSQAIHLLGELQTLTGNQRLLFPNLRRPKTPMSSMTLNRVVERMGFLHKFSPHGFRATASTILNEMGYRPDVIERQLAHAPRDQVRAAYNRAEYLQERRTMMQNWADLLDAEATKVVPLRGRKDKAA